MYISRFQVGNYKCFEETLPLELKPGFNIITGQNNAGKTALTEALGLQFQANPHRSLKTVPAPDIAPSPISWIDLDFTVTREELLELLLAGPRTYNIATPVNDDPMARSAGFPSKPEWPLAFVGALLGTETLTFSLRKESGENNFDAIRPREIPSMGSYQAMAPNANQVQRSFLSVEIQNNKSFVIRRSLTATAESEIGVSLGQLLRSHVYRFSAERFNLGSHAFGSGQALLPNASNLPEVLNALQANVSKFNRLNQLVSEVLPQVRKVSVRPSPKGGNVVEVLIWTIDPESERIDLARPLAESGTGIGQVLAILYVTLTTVRPQIVVVDEPQSFLHPGAIRKLIEVLKSNSKHQFIIATHSPTVITSAHPATISLLRSKSGKSEIERVDTGQTKAMTIFLTEIGARLSDVFGADSVLWVEGATEEISFPLILDKIAKRSLMGTALLGVRNVGELEGRDAEKVFDIYSRLLRGNSLLPPAVGFLFDAECRTKEQQSDMRRRSRNRVDFLPRRMLENFLLIPKAIVALINCADNSRAAPVTEGEVQAFIDARSHDARYLCPAEGAQERSWIERIDGAKVLREMFSALTESRVRYEKTEHSVALVEWIIKHESDALKEIADILVRLLDAK